LGCAAAPNAYQRSIVLNTAGNYPAIGTPDRWIAGVLEARGYDVPAARWYGQGWSPNATRLRVDGWDLITASAKINERITWVDPPVTYRWTLYARTFGADGSERPASLEARADLDSVITSLGAAAALRDTAQPGPSTKPDGATLRLDRCTWGELVGDFVGLPPWGGTLATGTAAEQLVAAMEREGWTVARPMVGIRRQPGGVDVVTVRGGSWLKPRAHYEVRVAFCDSTGSPSPPRAEARADAARLVSLLESAVAPPR
jgi:hypothetical protein